MDDLEIEDTEEEEEKSSKPTIRISDRHEVRFDTTCVTLITEMPSHNKKTGEVGTRKVQSYHSDIAGACYYAAMRHPDICAQEDLMALRKFITDTCQEMINQIKQTVGK